MEHVALNNVQLDYLARDDPPLKPVFYGTVACDRLPKSPVKTTSQGYIVNTDPHDQPGQLWLAVWTDGNVCEVLDSYALPWTHTCKPLRYEIGLFNIGSIW